MTSPLAILGSLWFEEFEMAAPDKDFKSVLRLIKFQRSSCLFSCTIFWMSKLSLTPPVKSTTASIE